MADPVPYSRQFSYNASDIPDLRSNLNPEFDALVVAFNQAVDAIKDVRRSDGALPNEIVTLDSLNPAVTAFLEAKEAAATAAQLAAETAQSLSEQARNASQAARDQSQLARDASQTAQSLSELARDQSQVARTESRIARDTAKSERQKAEVQASSAQVSASSAFASKVEAQAAALAAQEAASRLPNTQASAVWVAARDFGNLTDSSSFDNEAQAAVRVDMALGAATIDLGGIA